MKRFGIWTRPSLGRRSFYAGLDDSRVMRLRRSNTTLNKPRGRDAFSLAFEKRIHLLPLTQVGDLYGLPVPPSAPGESSGGAAEETIRVLVVDLLLLEDVESLISFPASNPLYYEDWPTVSDNSEGEVPSDRRSGISSSLALGESGFSLPSSNKRHLRQYGDTTLLRNSFVREAAHGVSAQFHTAICINPFIDVDRFRREEAQVEMISAYRNILYEAAEVPDGRADVIRIPALCCDTCGPRFYHEIGKLNQQSLIKGFHRIGSEAKETLMLNPKFIVEVYVPLPFLQQFQRAFLEDAWETPESTLNPGRTALYPGLAPPRSLLPLEGWIGKRPELVEAIETEGRSLMSGVKYSLDGKPIEEREVLAELRVFGREKEQEEMLKREEETATQQGLEVAPNGNTVAPLRAGIDQN
ncbi:uncharacterized protein TEOVI_000038600 [Trypanosoma equiperdum]|uniref:Uncharacterized protein n=2 Tax=Trypanozoon TaxID=39700 RepID=Q586P3_TRYB2|nr:hypothetical protein, conserved [Trypanosoma brucei brucei TREU927]AAQ15895.1 hypothetical protein, conserved [Trypanosoma brucei brucei TREU927]AAX80192.1 hypothetical protein, conserved [Trypanosoma brucei]SCU66975.1 hypothetical protein, conserved [Trypanosoma equiperdum]